MAQIILHRADDDNQKAKDQTRNLGIQSIVKREDNEVKDIISDANYQASAAATVISTSNKLATVAQNLAMISRQFYNVLQQIYNRSYKTIGGATIVNEATRVASETLEGK